MQAVISKSAASLAGAIVPAKAGAARKSIRAPVVCAAQPASKAAFGQAKSVSAVRDVRMFGDKCSDPMIRDVIKEMLDACADITEALRSALVTVEGSSNTFGDAQLSVDVIADNIMWEACKNSKVIAYGASEEEPEVKPCNPNGEYTVCWDPLDGSSIVDNNWAVGTMVGIWGSKSGTGADGLLGATGRDQVTSLVALYGPRTTVLVCLDDGVYEFSYGCTPEGCQLSDGTFAPWICSRFDIKISPDCKIFSPANMRASKEVEGYKKLLDHYMDNKFTLRYTGWPGA
eukprot:jgi/Tetstr1/460308/TSEL_005608.t1